MKKLLVFLLALVLALSLCCMAAAENVTYPSRGETIFATLELPEGDGPFPLVVLAHGHGGSRDENVGFGAIAEALKAHGIASIRMDFPGCGESTESFEMNTLDNMKEDVLSAISFALENPALDPAKVGLFGYSMGGRLALELTAQAAYDFSALVLLAPANSTEDMKRLFGGAENWDVLQATAIENGFANFTTIYGQEQELSRTWFENLLVMEDPAGEVAALYSEPALVIYGTDDEAVAPAVSEAVAQALAAPTLDATGDGHSYGFYSDKTDVLRTVAQGAADFFATAFGE